MKNANFKMTAVLFGLLLFVCSTTKAQSSSEEADKAARELGLPTGKEMVEKSMLDAMAAKEKADRERAAKEAKPSPSPSEKPAKERPDRPAKEAPDRPAREATPDRPSREYNGPHF